MKRRFVLSTVGISLLLKSAKQNLREVANDADLLEDMQSVANDAA
jgi:hypothetical protein